MCRCVHVTPRHDVMRMQERGNYCIAVERDGVIPLNDLTFTALAVLLLPLLPPTKALALTQKS